MGAEYFQTYDCVSKSQIVRSAVLLDDNICEYSVMSPDGKTNSQIEHILTGDDIQVYLTHDLSQELTVILITASCVEELRGDCQ
jgi:hypothetical protein